LSLPHPTAKNAAAVKTIITCFIIYGLNVFIL
jgi:hypothetical protein